MPEEKFEVPGHVALAAAERIVKLETLAGTLAGIVSDHEKRIRLLERVVGYGSGALGMGFYLLKVLKVI